MNNYISNLLQKHKNEGIFLDTNILLMFFVGFFNPEEIPKFKRTKMFVEEDYTTLVNILNIFKKIITTPNILTEVSNLSGQLNVKEHLKYYYFDKFAKGITILDEHYCPSANISKLEEFRKFGLTDAGIFHIIKDNYLLITDDFRLSNYLQKNGIDVLNFNHIRLYGWKWS